jgi:hypothetical protein
MAEARKVPGWIVLAVVLAFVGAVGLIIVLGARR